MKDAFGKELEIGDFVAVTTSQLQNELGHRILDVAFKVATKVKNVGITKQSKSSSRTY